MITMGELQELNEYCRKILKCLDEIGGTGDIKEAQSKTKEVLKSMRKLMIASILYEKKLICISGLQGAGKTTLLKSFYKIDDRYLNPTIGRGERIPVLISEKKGISEPSMYARQIGKDENLNYILQDVLLQPEEITDAVSGNNEHIMYLELYVPYKHVYSESTSFVLLPGFEKKNDYWKNLIEFSVNSSDAAVFVFNETSFSNSSNEDYLKRLEGKFGKNMIYVISGADGSLDDNEEVKKTCMDVLNIPEQEADRVVCTGLYADEEKNNRWIQQFKDALEKYAYREVQYMQRNSNYIYEEISNIQDLLYEIREIVTDEWNETIEDHKNDKLLKEFDVVVRRKKRELERNLIKAFESGKNESGKKLEELFDEQPMKNYLKRLFSANNVKEQYTRPREMVENALKDDRGQYLPDRNYGKALQETLSAWDNPAEETRLKKLIGVKDSNGEEEGIEEQLPVIGEENQRLLADVKYLLADSAHRQKGYIIENKSDKNLMGAIAEIGTYYFGLASYAELEKAIGLPYYEPSQINFNADNVMAGMGSSKRFVAGIAGIMGIDLIEDGTINFVSQLASSFGMATPVAGGIATIAIGIGGVSVILKDLNRMQREDFRSAKNAVDGVYNSIKINALNMFDEYMGKLRERLEDNIEESSGSGKRRIVKYNAANMINNALELTRDILEKNEGHIYGMESTIS